MTTCALSIKRVKRSKVAAPRPVFKKKAAEANTSGCASEFKSGQVSKQYRLRKCRQSTLPVYTLCHSPCCLAGLLHHVKAGITAQSLRVENMQVLPRLLLPELVLQPLLMLLQPDR